jgi:hypothetical protein
LEVNAFKAGRFMLQFNLWNKTKKCNWGLIIVYGAAQEEIKEDFIAELSSFCNSMLVPYVVGGDFNILRHAEEKILILFRVTLMIFLILLFILWAFGRFICMDGNRPGQITMLTPLLKS